MVTIRVVDEVAGVHFEKAGKQEAGGVGEMGAGAGLDLGEIALGKRFAEFIAQGADELTLRERAIQTAQATFDITETTEFIG